MGLYNFFKYGNGGKENQLNSTKIQHISGGSYFCLFWLKEAKWQNIHHRTLPFTLSCGGVGNIPMWLKFKGKINDTCASAFLYGFASDFGWSRRVAWSTPSQKSPFSIKFTILFHLTSLREIKRTSKHSIELVTEAIGIKTNVPKVCLLSFYKQDALFLGNIENYSVIVQVKSVHALTMKVEWNKRSSVVFLRREGAECY